MPIANCSQKLSRKIASYFLKVILLQKNEQVYYRKGKLLSNIFFEDKCKNPTGHICKWISMIYKNDNISKWNLLDMLKG